MLIRGCGHICPLPLPSPEAGEGVPIPITAYLSLALGKCRLLWAFRVAVPKVFAHSPHSPPPLRGKELERRRWRKQRQFLGERQEQCERASEAVRHWSDKGKTGVVVRPSRSSARAIKMRRRHFLSASARRTDLFFCCRRKIISVSSAAKRRGSLGQQP